MENASKALVIAGTVLISILVISVGILVFNQMSDYQKSRSDLVKDKQVAKFNEGFTQYINDDIKGIDIITVANKVNDYNKKEIDYGVINYDKKIDMTIDMTKYDQTNSIFEKKSYNSEEFINKIKQYTNLEEKYSIKVLGLLYSNIESLKKYYSEGKVTEGKDIKQVLGTERYNETELIKEITRGSFSELEKYSEYAEFKGKPFKGNEPKYNEKGQINEMSFEFVKK